MPMWLFAMCFVYLSLVTNSCPIVAINQVMKFGFAMVEK
jgi:hypothetical protein